MQIENDIQSFFEGCRRLFIYSDVTYRSLGLLIIPEAKGR